MKKTKNNELMPQITSRLRHNILTIPEEVYKASGIVIYGKRIKSFVFTTDIAIIRNCNADAVFAVYPFTPQQAISNAIIQTSYIPVFCGVGGGITNGRRTVTLAKDVEAQGAMGVIFNAPISNENIKAVHECVDIPIIVTVVNDKTDIGARFDAGVSILNVAGGENTPEIIKSIRKNYPDVPIIASGGNRPDLILKTIEAGANAITYTPPSTRELFKNIMDKYREV